MPGLVPAWLLALKVFVDRDRLHEDRDRLHGHSLMR
jgi:hypothetical protein